jgi:hypothetical protein
MVDSQHRVRLCRTVQRLVHVPRIPHIINKLKGILTVFFKNLQRRHALSLRISLACFRWSGLSGPFRFPTRFSVSGFPFADCFRTFVSAVFAAMGLLRDGFLVGGEVDDACDPAKRVGDGGFLVGTGIGRTIATGLTAVGDCEPCDVWSNETRRAIVLLKAVSKLVSELGELTGFEISTKLPYDVE